MFYRSDPCFSVMENQISVQRGGYNTALKKKKSQNLTVSQASKNPQDLDCLWSPGVGTSLTENWEGPEF